MVPSLYPSLRIKASVDELRKNAFCHLEQSLPNGAAVRWVVDTASLFPVKLNFTLKDVQLVTDYSRFTPLAKTEAESSIRNSLASLPERR
jgi:hypothetical protein